MNPDFIIAPTAVVDKVKAQANIRMMAEKCARLGLVFRPHFKTHQSAEVGEWFRGHGVEGITVSSMKMARYFAACGWRDITVAFPAHPRETVVADELASRIHLGLLFDSFTTAELFAEQLSHPSDAWIEIDAGYRRSGIPHDNLEEIFHIAELLASSPKFRFRGILNHAGNSYDCRGKEQIIAVHEQSCERMRKLKSNLEQRFDNILISTGDNPLAVLQNLVTMASMKFVRATLYTTI